MVSENKDVWGRAIDMPDQSGRDAGVSSVSCASPGNCAAGGSYSDITGGIGQGWVAFERNGHWGRTIPVPGLAALNKGGEAWVSEVSCSPPSPATEPEVLRATADKG